MNSYSKIVFGLKYYQHIYECRRFMELIHSLRIIISEHNAVTDNCERPGLHYHGIIEHGTDTNVSDNDAIVLLRTDCAYFKIENCYSPEQFVADLVQPPKKVMFLEITKSFNLAKYYSKVADFADVRLESSHFERESWKMSDIKSIIETILGRRIFDLVEISKQIEKDNYYCSPPKELQRLVKDSIALVRQMILNQSILELCGRFLKWPENYYSVQESADLVVEWCRYQNIDIRAFTMNLVTCLDKQVLYKNSLYFEGSSESGIMSIIRSIAEACVYTGEVDNESTGYTYVWEECLEKRFIILKDPAFDECMLKELDSILRGIGTLVPHRHSTMKYLCRTPVIVLCDENDSNRRRFLKSLQNSFLKFYVNLKPFVKLHNTSRLLHPDWLNVLHHFFIGHEVNYTGSSTKNTMDSELSCESNSESEFPSPIAFQYNNLLATANPGCSQDA